MGTLELLTSVLVGAAAAGGLISLSVVLVDARLTAKEKRAQEELQAEQAAAAEREAWLGAAKTLLATELRGTEAQQAAALAAAEARLGAQLAHIEGLSMAALRQLRANSQVRPAAGGRRVCCDCASAQPCRALSPLCQCQALSTHPVLQWQAPGAPGGSSSDT